MTELELQKRIRRWILIVAIVGTPIAGALPWVQGWWHDRTELRAQQKASAGYGMTMLFWHMSQYPPDAVSTLARNLHRRVASRELVISGTGSQPVPYDMVQACAGGRNFDSFDVHYVPGHGDDYMVVIISPDDNNVITYKPGVPDSVEYHR